jgi:hypothetical protein
MLGVMRSNRQNPTFSRAARIGLIVAAWAAASSAPGQTSRAAPPDAEAAPITSSLAERQSAIRERLQRLESSMLELSRVLAETEPEKAERLREALDYVGSQRLKTRLTKLGKLLETDQFSEADHRQELLLADLDALLTLLTSSLNEVERRREERQRLEALKRAVRELLDEQTQIFYRTRHAEQRAQQAAEMPNDVADMLRQLEQLQRDAQRRAGELQRDMRQPTEQERETPGEPQIGRAAEHMQRAADALGESQPTPAKQDQQSALEQLQQALDELDDALRQVRREESEETLAALEARFRSMLTREQQVLATVHTLDDKGSANWARVDRLQLAEAVETQHGVRDDCAATLRILVDEGTTVIVPELLRQVEVDMADVAAALERLDTSRQTQRVLDDIIALLEEVLEAIERKREEDARLAKEGQQQSRDGAQPLLPGSAELKLMRSSQLRLNERTVELAVSTAVPEDERAADMERLSQRQRRLAELARRMNERK